VIDKTQLLSIDVSESREHWEAITKLSVAIRHDGDLYSPKSKPRLVAYTCIMNIVSGNYKWATLDIINGELYWKKARYKTINSDYFEGIIKKELAKYIGG
jgi:hypothetical protein